LQPPQQLESPDTRVLAGPSAGGRPMPRRLSPPWLRRQPIAEPTARPRARCADCATIEFEPASSDQESNGRRPVEADGRRGWGKARMVVARRAGRRRGVPGAWRRPAPVREDAMAQGTITQVIGSTFGAQFPATDLPDIYNAVSVNWPQDGQHMSLTGEVQQ